MSRPISGLEASARFAFEHGWDRVCAFLPKGVVKSGSPEAKVVREALRRAAKETGVQATTHLSDGRIYAFVVKGRP